MAIKSTCKKKARKKKKYCEITNYQALYIALTSANSHIKEDPRYKSPR